MPSGEGRLAGVLLDLDETLVDTRASFAMACAAVARAYLPHLGEQGPELALAHWYADRAGAYRRYAGGALDFAGQRRVRAQALHADLGGPDLDDDGFAAWQAVYEAAFQSSWQPLPGARALVDALTSSGLAFGAVTNHETGYQREKLRRVGLPDVELLVGLDTLGVGKPDARVFAEGCWRLGTGPGSTAYLGNDLVADALGARDAGLVAVWLADDAEAVRQLEGRPEPEGVVRVRSLAQALDVLDLGGRVEPG
jgi:putative hydrolase of the HAD superfamily